MRIAVFGATGFVGSYIVDAIVDAGMTPACLVRSGSQDRLTHPERSIVVNGDISDNDAILRTLDGADAVIYNIGILREIPKRGVTFEALHYDAARRTMELARQAGVTRFILMSANGVKPGGTAYQRTKFRAEQVLAEVGLEWTVFRPSVIFGAPRGRMEFATQLLHDIIDAPLPAPLFYRGVFPANAGSFELSPVHVRDVASAFVSALQRRETVGSTYSLGGPVTLSWRAILETIAAAVGKDKLMIPVPVAGIQAAARLLDWNAAFPITRDQIEMLLEGNTCSSEAFATMGIEPVSFDAESLRYLNSTNEENESWQQNAA
jgi:NADH dehydrogenase